MNITKAAPTNNMTEGQMTKYPVSLKLQHRLWLQTNLHPFGFFVTDAGRAAIDIRISDNSLLKGVSLEERIEFMLEADARMLELGYIRQGKGLDPRGFMTQTEARGVLWYWVPSIA